MFKEIKKNIYFDEKNKIKIIANSFIFSNIDKTTFKQLEDTSKLPNLYGGVIGLSDLHVGYGVPIGSAFATSLDNNPIISPEAVGFDINCGISLVRTGLQTTDISEKEYSLILKELLKLPIGLSSKGLKISKKDFEDICLEGLGWAYRNNYAKKTDKYYTDKNGHYKDASFSYLSKKAKERGFLQVGTLGEGNHFIDLMSVSNIYDRNFCKSQNIKKGELLLMLHSGSRGFGHQVATDYINKCPQKIPLSYFDFNSKLGQEYYKSMSAASNFAFVNRAVIRTKILEVLENALNLGPLSSSLFYDITHNNASIETHNKNKILIHRKGAVHCQLPEESSSSSRFKESGSPVILPGSMLDHAHVLLPKPKVKDETLSTLAHGCGRLLSRKKAKENIFAQKLKEEMLKENIHLSGHSENTLREEQPNAYKPSKEVIDSLVGAGLCKRAFSLKPKLVVTG